MEVRERELPVGIITAEDLRAAVRAKLDDGISSRAISLLVCAYAQPKPDSGRPQRGWRRLPIETIPEDWRAAFIAALDRLREDDVLADRGQQELAALQPPLAERLATTD